MDTRLTSLSFYLFCEDINVINSRSNANGDGVKPKADTLMPRSPMGDKA